MGFRVLIAADPQRALDRYRQQPFDLIIIDAGTTGEDGILVYERILMDAERKKVSCAGILMLNQEQDAWRDKIQPRPKTSVLVQPVKLKQLLKNVEDVMA
jgi:DNA-binding response OmpR family regulator